MAENSRKVTDAGAFSHGSLAKQFVFAVITLGIYIIYWWHKLHKQLAAGTDADFSPGWRTVGMFIPFYNFVVMWRDSHDSEAVTGKDGILVFLLLLVFAPAAWFLIQTGINDVARGAGD